MPQELDVIYEGDCLDILPTLPENSIDMILCDLPYGTTAVAAINAGRHYIGIEKNPEYVTIARNRAAEAHGQTKLSITEWEDGI